MNGNFKEFLTVLFEDDLDLAVTAKDVEEKILSAEDLTELKAVSPFIRMLYDRGQATDEELQLLDWLYEKKKLMFSSTPEK